VRGQHPVLFLTVCETYSQKETCLLQFTCMLGCVDRGRHRRASKDADTSASRDASLQVGDAMRCPATKFITHTLSNLSFLILLATATFRLDDRSYPINSVSDLVARRFDVPLDDQVDCLLRNTFRPANVLMTNIQICILFWILGKWWMALVHGFVFVVSRWTSVASKSFTHFIVSRCSYFIRFRLRFAYCNALLYSPINDTILLFVGPRGWLKYVLKRNSRNGKLFLLVLLVLILATKNCEKQQRSRRSTQFARNKHSITLN